MRMFGDNFKNTAAERDAEKLNNELSRFRAVVQLRRVDLSHSRAHVSGKILSKAFI